MPTDPAVTAMMAVRNRVTLMDESIRSVLAQDDPDLELVIVDDCSDDGSWESAQAWGDRDARVRALRMSRPSGISAVRNRAVAAARGHYLATCDSDDLSHVDRFRLLRTYLDHHPDVIGVGGHSYGAHTTMLLAGMTVNTGILKKQRKSFADPRPRVFVMVSPQGTGRIIDTQSFSTMTPPSLFVTGSKDEVGVNPPPYTWRLEPFQHAPPRDKYLLFIDGAHHGFGGISGRRFPGSGEDDSDQVEAVRSVALAMFDAYLKNDPDARAYLIHNALSEASAGRFQLTGK